MNVEVFESIEFQVCICVECSCLLMLWSLKLLRCCAAQGLLGKAPAAGAQLPARGGKNKAITVENPKLLPVPRCLLPQTPQIYVP